MKGQTELSGPFGWDSGVLVGRWNRKIRDGRLPGGEYIWIWIFSLGSQPVSSKMTSTHRDPDVKWYRGFMHAHSRQLQIRQQHQAAAICSATNSGNSAWSASASCSTSSATACTLLSHLRVSFPTSTSARPLPFSPDASRPSK